jgi:hypothetical protein
MWCCTARQCNIHYTEQAVQDLGFSLPFSMEFLTCHELQHQSPKSSGQASTISRPKAIMVPLLTLLAFALVAATAFLLRILWRLRRDHRDGNMKEV